MTNRRAMLWYTFLSIATACSSSDGSNPGTDAGRGTAGSGATAWGGTGGSTGGTSGSTSGGNSGAAGTGGGAGSTCDPSACHDAFNCTVDGCNVNGCTHVIGPNSGTTACPPGQYCTVEKGCSAAPACATDQDCIDAWQGDACKHNPQCDPASSVCVFEMLDKDGDGSAPSVCGGADCDDSDPEVYPGATEFCNGKDDDCNGQIDDGSDEALCGPTDLTGGEECVSGTCTCLPDHQCGSDCIDIQRSPLHCGSCAQACDTGYDCVSGTCTCAAPETVCNGACVDPYHDVMNCGGCGHTCAQFEDCDCGVCVCGNEKGGTCPPKPGGSGSGGSSGSGALPLRCVGTCVDAHTDVNNCGSCGTKCPAGVNCAWGKCQ